MNMHSFRSIARLGVAIAALGTLLMATRIQAQCQTVLTHSGANFTGGSFVVQAGFAENEGAAASYTLDASAFPIKINLIEMIFATYQATQQTTTQWQVFVYDGTPDTGTLLYSYDSDGDILPHITCGPGTAGVNVQFSIDPSDPEQMYVYDTTGTHTFTVGYRITHHNNPPANPCLQSPDRYTNCFPTTDADGLLKPNNNWLYAIDCGALGAPPGWHKFSQLPVIFRPTGDWVLRATFESLNAIGISQQPSNQQVALGAPAIFQVVGTGANLQFQWYKGTTPVTNNSHTFGATTDTLFIYPTQQSDAGNYKCVVSNNCGSATSNDAILSFNGPTITGHVDLQQWGASPNGKVVTLRCFSPGSYIQLASVNATLDANGNYSAVLPNTIGAGTYDFDCKTTHWLRNRHANQAITSGGASGVNFSLMNGDVINDNVVDLGDFDAFAGAFGSEPGNGNWNVNADLNGDLVVDLGDFDILSMYYGQEGD